MALARKTLQSKAQDERRTIRPIEYTLGFILISEPALNARITEPNAKTLGFFVTTVAPRSIYFVQVDTM